MGRHLACPRDTRELYDLHDPERFTLLSTADYPTMPARQAISELQKNQFDAYLDCVPSNGFLLTSTLSDWAGLSRSGNATPTIVTSQQQLNLLLLLADRRKNTLK